MHIQHDLKAETRVSVVRASYNSYVMLISQHLNQLLTSSEQNSLKNSLLRSSIAPLWWFSWCPVFFGWNIYIWRNWLIKLFGPENHTCYRMISIAQASWSIRISSFVIDQGLSTKHLTKYLLEDLYRAWWFGVNYSGTPYYKMIRVNVVPRKWDPIARSREPISSA